MEETIKALREGNHTAYQQLFDSCYDALCRYAYSILKDMNEAEDVVQKTFCKLWDMHENLNIQSSINSYLYRMVHNDCINTIHQNTSHLEHNLNYISSLDAENNSTIHHIESTDLQTAIEKALLVLPPQCRKVFEMSRFEQLSYSEIGVQLNISTNTVENHISKALKILRFELKDFLSFWLLIHLLK
ncbi:MAG: RNA polymerase sigma-70 factor [Paludibacter sp.]|jgi:RNA polymerase sigma-70 factor (ECF subfamily)